MAAPALQLVTATAPAEPVPLAQAIATYRAKQDQLIRARARLAVIESEHQAAARAVYVGAGKRRPLILGDSVVYVEGTQAAPVIRIVTGEVVG